jgi:hypothetical protein
LQEGRKKERVENVRSDSVNVRPSKKLVLDSNVHEGSEENGQEVLEMGS